MTLVLGSPWAGRVPRLLVLAGLLVAGGIPPCVRAAGQLIEFDIPAGPLDLALSAYGEAARTQLIFEPAITERRRVNGLRGTFSAEAGLRQLLAGTGITLRAIGDEGFTLVAEPQGNGRGSSGTPATVQRFNAYSAALQDAVHDALCRHQETAPGSYRVLARAWISPAGLTDHAELLTSSGDAHRDALLAESLRGLAVGLRPPAGLPQPVTLLITSERTDANYCPASQMGTQGRETSR